MNTSLKHLLQSDRIPSLPEVALRVVDIAQAAEPDLDEIVRAIKGDPAIAGRIVKTVNSALFGFGQRVSSIEAAVPILGTNLVRTLVLSFTLTDDGGSRGAFRQSYQRVWRSSITQAVAAETLALDITGVEDTVWFLGGILQDIGRLALLSTSPDAYSQLLNSVEDGPGRLAAERELFGFTHIDVSVQLGLQWRLENTLVDGISKHHTEVRPWRQPGSDVDLTRTLLPNGLRCAALITEFVESLRCGRETSHDQLKRDLKVAFQIEKNEEIEKLIRDVDIRTSEVAAMFSVDLGKYLSIDQILDRARTTLADIALKSQLPAPTLDQRFAVMDRELS